LLRAGIGLMGGLHEVRCSHPDLIDRTCLLFCTQLDFARCLLAVLTNAAICLNSTAASVNSRTPASTSFDPSWVAAIVELAEARMLSNNWRISLDETSHDPPACEFRPPRRRSACPFAAPPPRWSHLSPGYWSARPAR